MSDTESPRRPAKREAKKILLRLDPEVHAAVAKWRREQQIERTRRVRPDLLPPE